LKKSTTFTNRYAKQDKHDATLRRVLATIVAEEKQQIGLLHIAKSLLITLVTQHAVRVRYIIIRGQSGSTTFFRIIS